LSRPNGLIPISAEYLYNKYFCWGKLMSYWNSPHGLSRQRNLQPDYPGRTHKTIKACKPVNSFECFKKIGRKVVPVVGGSGHPRPVVVQVAVPTSCEVNVDEYSRLAAGSSNGSHAPQLHIQNFVLRPQDTTTDWKGGDTGSEMLSIGSHGDYSTNQANLGLAAAVYNVSNDVPVSAVNGYAGTRLFSEMSLTHSEIAGDPISHGACLSRQVAPSELHKNECSTVQSTDISTVPPELSNRTSAGSLVGTQTASQSRSSQSAGNNVETIHASSDNIP
jgi:hypothetical protein